MTDTRPWKGPLATDNPGNRGVKARFSCPEVKKTFQLVYKSAGDVEISDFQAKEIMRILKSWQKINIFDFDFSKGKS